MPHLPSNEKSRKNRQMPHPPFLGAFAYFYDFFHWRGGAFAYFAKFFYWGRGRNICLFCEILRNFKSRRGEGHLLPTNEKKNPQNYRDHRKMKAAQPRNLPFHIKLDIARAMKEKDNVYQRASCEP